MAEKFSGTFDELENHVTAAGFSGEWRDCGDKHQFRAQNGEVLNWFKNGTLQFQGKNQNDFKAALLPGLTSGAPIKSSVPISALSGVPENNKKIFIVHGHDSQAKEQLELILMKLGLQAFILQNNDAGGRTLIEALEQNIYEGSAVGVILITPDDFGYPAGKGEADRQPRARQNVILELGMVMARLGRDKTIILKKGAVEMPSDINGIQYHEFNSHVKEIVSKLVQRLTDLGFAISAENITSASS